MNFIEFNRKLKLRDKKLVKINKKLITSLIDGLDDESRRVATELIHGAINTEVFIEISKMSMKLNAK